MIVRNLSVCFMVLTFLLISCGNSREKEKSVAIRETQKKEIEPEVVTKKKWTNGIVIYWYKQGTGDLLKEGDMVNIEYEVKLKDGKIIDGNKLVNKKMLPFLVGFNLQTKGWDLAFQELKVGDRVKILIPSKLARGDKGIKGLIPPNADNWLYVNVLSIKKPTKIIDGTRVWLLEENKDNKLKFNDENAVVFHAIASTPTTNEFVNTFRLDKPFIFRLKDHGLVPGLRKALMNAKKFDRLFVVAPSDEAYGEHGFLDIVKPNESVFYNVLVMDVVKPGSKS
jgi:FKBP-type peptidyl-prolyl cis-trans isomerase